MALIWSAYRRRLASSSKNSQARLILMKVSVASSSLLRSGWYFSASILQFFRRMAKSAQGGVLRMAQGSPPRRSIICLRVSILQELYIIASMAFNQWYKGVRDYIWPLQTESEPGEQQENEKMGRLARLRRLSQLLESCSYSQTEKQQICMFYGSLIDEYPQARASKQHPAFLCEPQVYVPRLSFTLMLKVQTPQLYCELELVVAFLGGLARNLPLFYIRNPDFNKYKPRERFVRFGKEQLESQRFQAVFGGVQVLMPEVSGERWSWTAQSYFKEGNVLSMVKWVHKFLLPDCFPFATRKTPLSTDIYAKAQQLRQFIEENVVLPQQKGELQEIPLLQAIQSAHSLAASIDAETNAIREDIAGLKDFMARSQHFTVSQFMPQPRDKKSEIILDALSSLEACKDVESEMEKQFLKGGLDLGKFKSGMEEISHQKFNDYFRLAYWKSPELLW